MKKTTMFCLTLVFLLALVACGGGGDKPKDNPADKQYTITAENTADYEFGLTNKTVKANDKIEFTLKVLATNSNVKNVYYEYNSNKKNCNFANEKYSFTMPQADVKLGVELEKIVEVASSNGLAWDTFFNQVATAEEGKTYVPSFHNTRINFTYDHTKYCTRATVSVTSSNQAVIPAAAMECETITNGTSNIIAGGYVSIDSSKIKVGETYLTVSFTPDGKETVNIVKKITVREFGKIEDDVYQNVQIKFDLSKISGLSDIRYVINAERYGSIEVNFSGDLTETKTLSFDLIRGCEYIIGVSYKMSGNVVDLELNDVVIGGNSTTGFSQLKDGRLVLLTSPEGKEIVITPQKK